MVGVGGTRGGYLGEQGGDSTDVGEQARGVPFRLFMLMMFVLFCELSIHIVS